MESPSQFNFGRADSLDTFIKRLDALVANIEIGKKPSDVNISQFIRQNKFLITDDAFRNPAFKREELNPLIERVKKNLPEFTDLIKTLEKLKSNRFPPDIEKKIRAHLPPQKLMKIHNKPFQESVIVSHVNAGKPIKELLKGTDDEQLLQLAEIISEHGSKFTKLNVLGLVPRSYPVGNFHIPNEERLLAQILNNNKEKLAAVQELVTDPNEHFVTINILQCLAGLKKIIINDLKFFHYGSLNNRLGEIANANIQIESGKVRWVKSREKAIEMLQTKQVTQDTLLMWQRATGTDYDVGYINKETKNQPSTASLKEDIGVDALNRIIQKAQNP